MPLSGHFSSVNPYAYSSAAAVHRRHLCHFLGILEIIDSQVTLCYLDILMIQHTADKIYIIRLPVKLQTIKPAEIMEQVVFDPGCVSHPFQHHPHGVLSHFRSILIKEEQILRLHIFKAGKILTDCFSSILSEGLVMIILILLKNIDRISLEIDILHPDGLDGFLPQPCISQKHDKAVVPFREL